MLQLGYRPLQSGDWMRKLYKYSTFFLSYTPLWLSILFLDWVSLFLQKTVSPWTERMSVVLILILYAVSFFILVLSLTELDKEGTERVTVKKCEEHKSEVMEYLLSCVLPMFAFDFTLWTQVVLFMIYFIALALVCISHNIMVPNIILCILKYRFYHIEAEDTYGCPIERDVLSREKLMDEVGEDIILRPINADIYYNCKRKSV